jgi:hypothetical protein
LRFDATAEVRWISAFFLLDLVVDFFGDFGIDVSARNGDAGIARSLNRSGLVGQGLQRLLAQHQHVGGARLLAEHGRDAHLLFKSVLKLGARDVISGDLRDGFVSRATLPTGAGVVAANARQQEGEGENHDQQAEHDLDCCALQHAAANAAHRKRCVDIIIFTQITAATVGAFSSGTFGGVLVVFTAFLGNQCHCFSLTS